MYSPSRASFLTGRYPRATRSRQNGQLIPADEILLQKLFDPGRGLIRLCLEYIGDLIERLLAGVDPLERAFARHRFDSANA